MNYVQSTHRTFALANVYYFSGRHAGEDSFSISAVERGALFLLTWTCAMTKSVMIKSMMIRRLEITSTKPGHMLLLSCWRWFLISYYPLRVFGC